MSDILIGNGTVVTLDAANSLVERGAVLIHDGRLAYVLILWLAYMLNQYLMHGAYKSLFTDRLCQVTVCSLA